MKTPKQTANKQSTKPAPAKKTTDAAAAAAPPAAPTLQELAAKYKTDKLEHGYMPYYMRHLPQHPEFMLEIGAFKGASLKMWRAGFPGAHIHAVDLYTSPKLITEAQVFALGCVPLRANQGSVMDLQSIADRWKYNVIIDDGSHNSDHQLISFRELFLNALQPRGLYVVEDLHCCKEEFYHNSINNPEVFKSLRGFDDTILVSLQEWQKTKVFKNYCFNEEENKAITKLIGDVAIYDEKIAFVFKK